MRRMLGWTVVAVVALGLVVSCTLYVAVSRRQHTFAGRNPLALEELDRLAEKRTSLAVRTERATGPEASEGLSAPPGGLQRIVSPEALAHQWMAKDGKEKRVAARNAEVIGAIESILWTFGAEPTAARWACGTGVARMEAGDWDAARQYFSEVLDTPPSPYVFREACARLAWLVEDPDEAARLLELSCGDDEWLSSIVQGTRATRNDAGSYALDDWLVRAVRLTGVTTTEAAIKLHASALDRGLSNAAELSRVTGSDALADHYLGRLRLRNPEAARSFERESEEEVR